jgi:predicted DsbA family dithiol-disulfide isomerase
VPVIEVFADVCCPFTHVGLRRTVERRCELGRDEPRLLVRAWPLELVNGAPLDPGFVAEEVEELRRQVAPDLFGGFDAAAFPASSLPAFALAASAYGRDLETGEAVSLALRDALFEHGRDIADPVVIADLASAHDLAVPTDDDRQRVFADWNEGRERGVVGSPHFFVAGTSLFCPVLDITKVDGRLRIGVDEQAMRDFFADVFLRERLPRDAVPDRP